MLVSNSHELGTLVARAAGYSYNPATDTNIARVERDELVGGVVFTGYTGASIAMHVAGFRPNWLNRDLLWASFHYPFVVLGCKKVLAWLPEAGPTLAFTQNLGFRIEARVADVFPSGNALVVSMSPENCRWLKLRRIEIHPGYPGDTGDGHVQGRRGTPGA
jgi:hypothetical protein